MNHHVSPKSKTGRQLIQIGKTPNPLPKELEDWNKRVEAEKNTRWIPSTPAGTPLGHLARKTEDEAWKALLKDAAHMPYKTKENFQKRGYTVDEYKKS
jgi:hypothetical protein